ncbi:hypothetical protein EVAR_18014_1 [Eumeta japonica]|uniref:Uncharacterized protein n=1 Tax=Eumeta variegata TaxID=151549 RepID=A0A4C1ZRN9_EUMVA|nr:hypothetical protein EVAR_18014_1 [Eumeta japonica]
MDADVVILPLTFKRNNIVTSKNDTSCIAITCHREDRMRHTDRRTNTEIRRQIDPEPERHYEYDLRELCLLRYRT